MVYGPFHSSTGEYQLGGLSRRVVAAPGSAPLDTASSEGGLVEDEVTRGIRDEDLDEVVVAVERRGKGDQVSSPASARASLRHSWTAGAALAAYARPRSFGFAACSLGATESLMRR